jgi:hypothetical protein
MTRAGLEEERRRSELFSKVKLSEADLQKLRNNIQVVLQLESVLVITMTTVCFELSRKHFVCQNTSVNSTCWFVINIVRQQHSVVMRAKLCSNETAQQALITYVVVATRHRMSWAYVMHSAMLCSFALCLALHRR